MARLIACNTNNKKALITMARIIAFVIRIINNEYCVCGLRLEITPPLPAQS
jgi:hypothetical protein